MIDLSLIKPEDLWYTIGLIATDGNLSKDGRHINITSKDKDLLIGIKKKLFLKNKLTLKANGLSKEKKYYFLQFGDVRFYKFLLELGITPKKSLTINSVATPTEYFVDFLRGVIDGDGCIRNWIHPTNNHVQWSLRVYSGSESFVTWLQNNVSNLYGANGKIHKHVRQKIFTIYILKYGKLAAQRILQKCYYKGCFALNRKQQLAMECINSTGKFISYGAVVV